ncbi:hypothetical protein DFJ74DRAFT_529919 [Hyaloraphidium curvatum]|nr:hypothetical protein DFJ74DRAFT_529919 [Hyaloraphidium curvatum]
MELPSEIIASLVAELASMELMRSALELALANRECFHASLPNLYRRLRFVQKLETQMEAVAASTFSEALPRFSGLRYVKEVECNLKNPPTWPWNRLLQTVLPHLQRLDLVVCYGDFARQAFDCLPGLVDSGPSELFLSLRTRAPEYLESVSLPKSVRRVVLRWKNSLDPDGIIFDLLENRSPGLEEWAHREGLNVADFAGHPLSRCPGLLSKLKEVCTDAGEDLDNILRIPGFEKGQQLDVGYEND